MTRATHEDLNHVIDLVAVLAQRFDSRNNPNGWPDVVKLLDMMVWQETERDHAKHAAAYGPGSDQAISTIGQQGGLNSPVEKKFHWGTDQRPRARPQLADPTYRKLDEMGRTMRHQLGELVDGWDNLGREVANWPQRTQDTG
jgi:hypothetical protein